MRVTHKDASLTAICRIYGVTRQAFYLAASEVEKSVIIDKLTLTLVKGLRKEISGLGARKLLGMMEPELARHNISIGRDQFFDLLRFHGLLIRRRRRIAKTTDSYHWLHKYPNLIQELEVNGPEQLWVSDITYIRTGQGFSYLSLITDAYSRKIVGYSLHPTLEATGCLDALNMAIAGRRNINAQRQLIHHSDRGIQYCCGAYVNALLKAGILISMTQTGSPYDNAMAERVNCTIKHDYFPSSTYPTHKSASIEMDRIVTSYNERRPHQSINFLTPEQAHQMEGPIVKRWKKYQKKKKNKIVMTEDAPEQ
jgi:putative transposase